MDYNDAFFLISHSSALELIRHKREDAAWEPSRMAEGPPISCACAQAGLLSSISERCAVVRDLKRPLHVLVGKSVNRCATGNLHPHLYSIPTVPPYSVYKEDRRVYGCGPEWTLMQMATTEELGRLVAYAMELCGSYTATNDEGGVLYNRPPVTDSATLRAFAQQHVAMRGSRGLLHACAYLCDGSASPRETALVEMISMWGLSALPTTPPDATCCSNMDMRTSR